MNFKPTKWKVIVSVIAVVLWILFLESPILIVACKMCLSVQCDSDFDSWMIVKPTCDCACQSLSEMLWSNFKNIVFPFAIIYIIWSIFEKRKNKESKNKSRDKKNKK